MKILLLNDYGVALGGAELLSFGIRNELRRRGHDARLLTTTAAREQMPEPSEAHRIDYACFGTMGRWRALLQTANPWAYRALKQALADFRPDVVHIRMFLTQLSPLVLPLLKSIPCVYQVVWYRPICPTGTKLLPSHEPCHHSAGLACYRQQCLPLRDWIPLMLQGRMWRRWRGAVDRILTNSEATKAALLADGLGPVQVVKNGVPACESRWPISGTPTVGYAGRLTKEKGVDVLLHAFAQVRQLVPTARLIIAGAGPERDALLHMAETLGLESAVTMVGHLSPSRLAETLGTAWVQVVPSRWAEPFGLVAVEAMMRGTAVVASNSGGLAEIVQDARTGYLVPPGDPDPLARKLLRILTDRSHAVALGQAGRHAATARFTLARHVDQLIQVYDELCRECTPLFPTQPYFGARETSHAS